MKNDKDKSDKDIEKKEINDIKETDVFVQGGMKPLTDEQLDQAIGGIEA